MDTLQYEPLSDSASLYIRGTLYTFKENVGVLNMVIEIKPREYIQLVQGRIQDFWNGVQICREGSSLY